MPALILAGPPVTAAMLLYLMQITNLPEPFSVIIQYGALGLIAWWLKRLVERLLDQVETIRRETATEHAAERERFGKLLENNTAALAINSEALGQVDDSVTKAVKELSAKAVCPLRQEPTGKNGD